MVFENALPNNPNLLHAMAASKLTLESTAVAVGGEGGGKGWMLTLCDRGLDTANEAV